MAAAGSVKNGSVNEIIDGMDAMSLKTVGKGQQTLDIQECWSEAKVRISRENWGEEKVLTGTPASSLQYLVQRKSKGLNEALKEFGCFVDEKNSQKFLTVCLTKKLPSDEVWNMNNWEKILEKIQVACDQICSKYISLKESELPFLVNEFSEDEKRCFEHNVQVIHATVDQYVLVGLKDEGKKSSEFLEKLCKEVLIEKIEDREIFDGLKLRENLEANFRNVKIKDEQSHLVLRGSEENVAECRQCYKNWFSLNVPDPGHESEKISETLYNKLISEQKRKDINKSLKKEGFCVYWRVSSNKHCFFLICYGLNEPRLGDALELVKREGEEIDKGAKSKKYPKEHERILEHTAGVLKIKRGITFECVESKKKEIEEKTSCFISLAKRDAEEPTYYKSWLFDKINFVIAEGSVENSVTDIIVCPVDENYQPAGESAEQIFRKGGWTELENAAQYCRSNCKFHNHPGTTDPKSCICLSSTTGSLTCRKILFLSMKGDLDVMWNNLRDEQANKAWRSIYFPVENSQLLNGLVDSILAFFSSKKISLFYFEVVFCIPRGRSEDLKQLESLCQKHLQCYPISFYIKDSRMNEGALTCS